MKITQTNMNITSVRQSESNVQSNTRLDAPEKARESEAASILETSAIPKVASNNDEISTETENNENTANGEADDEVLQKSVEQANKTLEAYDRKIERNVHEVTHAMMYTIKDTKTDEVIAEFPPKKIQDMLAKMWELAGLFVDEKA